MKTHKAQIVVVLALTACLSDRTIDRGRDRDGDGYHSFELGGVDCDDDDPAVNPGSAERCGNDIDDDCDGRVDDRGEGEVAFYRDFDGDGFPGSSRESACDLPDGAHFDLAVGVDCNDLDAGVHPDAPESWYDSVDQDCDGNDGDADGDGFQATQVGGTDCDDTRPDVNRDSVEVCNNGVDDNCDGSADLCGWESPRTLEDAYAMLPLLVDFPEVPLLFSEDVNGDGIRDLVLQDSVSIRAHFAPLSGFVARGDADLVLLDARVPDESRFGVHDLDENGDPEWLIGDPATETVRVWWNPSSGTRQRHMDSLPALIEPPAGTWRLGSGDFGTALTVLEGDLDGHLFVGMQGDLQSVETTDVFPSAVFGFSAGWAEGEVRTFSDAEVMLPIETVSAFTPILSDFSGFAAFGVLGTADGMPGLYTVLTSDVLRPQDSALLPPLFLLPMSWYSAQGTNIHVAEDRVWTVVPFVGRVGLPDGSAHATFTRPLGLEAEQREPVVLDQADSYFFAAGGDNSMRVFDSQYCPGAPFGDWLVTALVEDETTGLFALNDPTLDLTPTAGRFIFDGDLVMSPQCGDFTGDGVTDLAFIAFLAQRVVVLEGTAL